MKRTISVMMGKGSINHNSRQFTAENVDAEITKNNIIYCNEKIQSVYHELFDEALEKYNAKQTRKDRIIDNYYEKIRTGKQEKPFHEIVLQIGDKDNMSATTDNGELAKTVLDKYMKGFQERNPNLKVFSAHLHMDEATPHLHIDFVPFTTGSKRGLETRVSLKKALAAQGFVGGSRSDTEWNQWVQSEKEQLSKIMLEHNIEWDKKGTHEKHKTVSAFKREELAKEVVQLTAEKKKLESDISTEHKAENKALMMAKKLETETYTLPDPPVLMSAKAYKTKFVDKLIRKLKEIIKALASRCFKAEHTAKEVTAEFEKVIKERDRLKTENWNVKKENRAMKIQLRDFENIKATLGIDKVKEILKSCNRNKSKSNIDISI